MSRNSRKFERILPQYEGTVRMTRDGFIFVKVEGQEDEIFVKATRTLNALDGDTVKVVVTRESGRNMRREGRVTAILERSKRPFVGILHFVGAQAWVLMQSKSMPYDIEVDLEAAMAMGAEKGMKVAVVVDRWERREPAPSGHIVDILGMPGTNEAEMHAILTEFNLPYRFEKEVENAADHIPDEITDADMKGRKDFREVFTFTIDPKDAKDYDDALSFRKLDNGNFEIGVHIADVTWYVKPGSAVDKEARNRGTSVYLVDRTVPMLPEKLCNKLCSLRPDEDKLTFATIFEMTPDGRVLNSWIGRTAIRSNFRLDYDKVQAIIEDGRTVPDDGHYPFIPVVKGISPASFDNTAENYSAELIEAILVLNGLATTLRENRFKAGAINFDRPEMKVEVDNDGKPVNVYQKISKEANWLIEEFMLLANRTVAEFVAKKGHTFVYRIHDEPDLAKLESLRAFSKGFGYRTSKFGEGKPASRIIGELLEKAKGKPEYAAFEDIALRSMAKAKYSTDNIGHYGLAFKYYTHFTSPIRRYPDVMVHRLLSLYLSGKGSQNKEFFEEECVYASQREQVATDAERASVKYKLVEYMMDKTGQEFDGHITGVTEWGLYVSIEPTQIEGMVSLRDIRSDFYEYDEKLYRLVGKRTGKVYKLGDAVRIRVLNANLSQRLLDYELVEEEVQ